MGMAVVGTAALSYVPFLVSPRTWLYVFIAATTLFFILDRGWNSDAQN